MTLLVVMADHDAAEVRLRTDDARLIGDELATRDIVFGRRPIAPDRQVSRPPERILAEHAEQVAAINRDGRYRHIDVAALQPDETDPDWRATAAAARSKFLAEHRHAEDEVRFFVAGRACFYLHLEPEVLRGGVRGRGRAVGAGGHPALVRHGFAARLRGDPVLRAAGRLGRRLHRRCDRRTIPDARSARRDVIAAIVIDIEGTTSPTSSVREGLYGYTRRHLAPWLADNLDGAADQVIAETRELAGQPDAGPTEVAEILCDWLNSDVKAEPLKAAQGLICAEGFRSGALHGEFFHDVPAALASWCDSGFGLHIFSSGSVRNQQDWFSYARGGELASLISGWFDLAIAGAKRESSSYKTIAEAIDVEPNRDPLFVRPS